MNATIIRLGVRAMVGRRRGVLLFILPLVLILLAVAVRALAGAGLQTAEQVLPALGLHVLLPLIALIAAASLLAPEIDDGSIVYLLAKPVPRMVILASKLVVAIGCTVLFAVVPIVIAGFVLAPGAAGFVLGYALGALAGGVAYCALFSWLASLTRHAVVVGLLYVLLWEGLVGGVVAGVRWVSISWWAGAIGEAVDSRVHLVSPDLSAAYAVIATVVVLVGLSVLAARRLQGFNLTGDE